MECILAALPKAQLYLVVASLRVHAKVTKLQESGIGKANDRAKAVTGRKAHLSGFTVKDTIEEFEKITGFFKKKVFIYAYVNVSVKNYISLHTATNCVLHSSFQMST